jgi:hypothetical protein
MVTNPITQAELSEKEIIVRAYGDEPVRLHAVGSRGDVVEVAGQDREKRIGFPPNDVYEFDRNLFDHLRSAFVDNDRAKLRELWAKAVRFSMH